MTVGAQQLEQIGLGLIGGRKTCNANMSAGETGHTQLGCSTHAPVQSVSCATAGEKTPKPMAMHTTSSETVKPIEMPLEKMAPRECLHAAHRPATAVPTTKRPVKATKATKPDCGATHMAVADVVRAELPPR